ncbi:MAG: family 20 glycosylhydrolase [Bacteroidaceae bacterium]|nr:family 20 glycosylhydrolase [Bacteroidaceae bacterium]
MKRTFRKIGRWLACVCLIVSASSINAEVNPQPFVIPELQTWIGAEGEVSLSGTIRVNGNDKELLRVANAYASDYKTMFGKALVVKKGTPQAGDIVLALEASNKELGKEGYKLSIANHITVTAATTQGAFWATRTLLQLSEQHEALPKGDAIDVPAYELRGFMVDVARKFMPIDYLNDLVKVMAYYKMNALQVHLNDNGFRQFFGGDWNKTPSAFRLESTQHPGLTSKDGHYTKKEFIDLQILGENNYVEVIPEIDVPAHSLAFAHYKPQLGSKDYGMDHLDMFHPETYPFIDSVFREYLEGENPVFRSKRVNIGTDEYSNRDKKVVEKFREFTDHYIKFVESFGKQAMVWGALTHAKGETPVKSDNVIMNIWHNPYAQPKDMKELGYKLVSIPDGLVYIVPAAGYYYDYLNCNYLYNSWTPANIGGVQFEEGDPAILGGMFAVWNDHHGNGISTYDVHHRTYPALQTIAVKCWTASNTTLPYAQWDAKRWTLREAPGVNWLGRIGKNESLVAKFGTVKPGDTLPFEEIGYDYTVSFKVTGAKEEKGTKLFSSKHTTLYISDPREGKIGFERDGYLNTFNYRIPEGQTVEIAIQGNNKMTRLYVDGRLKEELGVKMLYVMDDRRKANYISDPNMKNVVLSNTDGDKIYYQRTLVFPLRNVGQFKSNVSNLKIWNYIKQF